MTQPSTHVLSPAGIRLVSGLLAPFLTRTGQADLARRWGVDAETLHKEAVTLAEQVGDHPALHAALGVWVRNHALPADAVARLAAFLGTLPSDPAAAQQVLDAWAAGHTHGMIPTFPCQVTEDTHAVLASAVAVEDTWARKTEEITMRFAGASAEGFEAIAASSAARSTTDGSAVRATLPLASGLEMAFCISTEGVESASRLVEQPEMFGVAVVAGQPFVTSHRVTWRTEDVAVRVPEFTTRSSLNIGADADAWGLRSAMEPHGVPGLGDLQVTEAKQDAFIEVTHTGVRAAAVTAVMMMRSAALLRPAEFEQAVVSFDGPFAYTLTHPDFPASLFTGVYAG